MSESVVWIDPDGMTTTFARVELNLRGRWFPTIEVDEETVPGQPGAQLWEVRHGPLEFSAAVWVSAATEPALRTAARAAVYAMDPTRGLGTWRNTAPGGDQRDLACVVVDGLSLTEDANSSGRWAQRFALVFRAHEPYWTDTADTVQDFTIGTSPSFFPIFPLRLTASEIAVDTTVTNAGDVEAWPVWTITGPGSGVVFRNLTTGESLDFGNSGGLTLTAGETVEVDTRPGRKTVLRSDGTNLWPQLTASSSMWSLAKGANAVRLEMASTTSASGLQLRYRPRYLSP